MDNLCGVEQEVVLGSAWRVIEYADELLNLLVTNCAVWNAAEPLAIQNWKKSGSDKGLSFKSEYPLCSWIDLISNTIGLLCVDCSKGYTSVMESSSLGFAECNRNSGLGFKLQT
jgi:hypothetical protein